MLRSSGLGVFVAVAFYSLAANAANEKQAYTPEQQARYNACSRDTVKFCKGVPPEDGPMLNCLKTHRAEISENCRNMLQSHGQ
jgi:hypothetical protein